MASRSWNKIELLGNLTRDIELRYTPSGTAVATIGLATNRTFVTDGEKREEVDFHKIVAWGKLAELCNQLLKKGNRVFMSGRLQYREWETQDGNKRRDAEIVLEDMILLTSRNQEEGSYNARVSEPVHEDVSEVISEPEPEPEPKTEPEPKDDEIKEEKTDKGNKAPAPDEVVADSDLPF